MVSDHVNDDRKTGTSWLTLKAIPLTDATSFSFWKAQVEATLKVYGMDCYLVEPSKFNTRQQEYHNEFEQNNEVDIRTEAVHCFLIRCMTQEVFWIVENASLTGRPTSIWDALVENFEGQASKRAVGYWKAFLNLQQGETEKIGKYVERFKDLVQKLRSSANQIVFAVIVEMRFKCRSVQLEKVLQTRGSSFVEPRVDQDADFVRHRRCHPARRCQTRLRAGPR